MMDVDDEPNVSSSCPPEEAMPVMVESSSSIMMNRVELLKDQDVVEVTTFFNCETCSNSVDYFLSENATNASQAEKYRKLYTMVKKKMLEYKQKYQVADFEHEECRALLESVASTIEDNDGVGALASSSSTSLANSETGGGSWSMPCLSSNANDLEGKIKKLPNVSELESKIRILRDFNKKLVGTVDEQKKQIKEITSENEALKSQNSHSVQNDKHLEVIKQELANRTKELDDLQDKYNSDWASWNKQLAESSSDNRDMSKLIKEMSDQLIVMKNGENELENRSKEWKEMEAKFKAEIDQLREHDNSSQSMIESLKCEIGQLTEAKSRMESEHASILQQLKTDNDKQKEYLEIEFNLLLDDRNKQIMGLEEQIVTLKAECQALNDRFVECESQLRAETERKQQLENEIASVSQSAMRVQELETRNTELNVGLEGVQNGVNQLRDEFAQAIEKSKLQESAYLEQITSLNSQVESLTSLSIQQQEDMATELMNQARDHYNPQIEALNNQIQSLTCQHEEIVANLTNKAQEQQASYLEQIESLNGQIQSLTCQQKEQETSLYQQIESLTSQIQLLTSQQDEMTADLTNKAKEQETCYIQQIESLTSQIESLSLQQKEQETSHMQQIESLNDRIQSLTTQHDETVTDLTNKTKEQEISYIQQIESLNNQIQSLSSQQVETESSQMLGAQLATAVSELEAANARVAELNTLLNDKDTQVVSLQTEVNRLGGEWSTLMSESNNKIAEYTSQLESLQSECQSLKEKLAECETLLKSEMENKQSLHEQVVYLGGVIESLNKQRNDSMEVELNSIRSTLDEKSVEYENLKKDYMVIETQKRELEVKLLDENARLNELFKSLTDQVEQFRAELQVKEEQLAKMKEEEHESDEVRAKIAQLEAKITAQSVTIDEITSEFANKQVEMTHSQDLIQNYEIDLSALREQLAAKNVEIGKFEELLATFRAEHVEQTEISVTERLNTHLSALVADVESKTAQLSEMSEREAEASRVCAELKEQLARQAQTLADQTSRLNESGGLIEELSSKLSEYTTILKRSEQRENELEMINQENETRIQQLTDQLNEANSLITDIKNEIDKQKKCLEIEFNSLLDDRNKHVEHLEEQIVALNGECQDLSDRFVDCETRLRAEKERKQQLESEIARVSQSAMRVDSLEAENTRLNGELLRAQETISHLEAELAETVDKAKERQASYMEQIENLNGQVELLTNQHLNIAKDLLNKAKEQEMIYQDHIESLNCQIDTLSAEQAEIAKELSMRNSELMANLAQMETTNANLTHAITMAQQKDEAQTEKIKELEAEYAALSALRAEFEQAQQFNTELSHSMETLKGEEEARSIEMVSLRATVDSQQAEIANLKSQLANCEAEKNQLASRLDELNCQFLARDQALSLELGKLELSTKDLSANLTECNASKEEYKAKYQKKSAEYKECYQQFKQLNDEYVKLQQQMKEAESLKRLEMDDLKKRFDESEMRLKNEMLEVKEARVRDETLIAEYKEQVASLTREKSRLMTVANESQVEFTNAMRDMNVKITELEKSCYQRQQAFKEKDHECETLKKKCDQVKRELDESVSKLTSVESTLALKSAEIIELKGRLCNSLMEKHERHEAAIHAHEETQKKMKAQIDTLKREIETIVSQNALQMTSLQSQLAASLDERMRQLNQINNLTEKVEQSKVEHKENKQLKQKLVRKNEEIEKIKDEMKAMRETNDTLVMQMNNLNEFVCELRNGSSTTTSSASNKENDAYNTSSSGLVVDGFEVVAPGGKKTLNDISNARGSGDSPVAKKLATTTSTLANDENNMPTTPSRGWLLSRPSIAQNNTNTPTSSVRRQNQCAQQ